MNTLTEAIYIVLNNADEPLTYKEILRRIQADNLAKITGRTPTVTVIARIGQEIKNNGEHSRFIRLKRGLIDLRERNSA
jgi:predicted Zn-ribbon and HTH transcriptional regulator